MAASITGFPQADVVGHSLVDEFITSEYKTEVGRVLDNALRGKETANFEFPLFTKGGQRVEVLLNATTRRDTSGEIVGVVGVGQDITERKKAEDELERVAKDLRALIDTANAPIFGIDKDGNVNEWNNMAAQITKYSQTEVLGHNLVEEFITSEFKTEVGRVLDKALRGRGTANFEFPLFTKDGQRVEVLLNATPRRGADGDIIGVVGVGQDITEKKETANELERVAHDLRCFIDTANAPIFGIDIRGAVNEWNEMTSNITQFSREEVMGKNLMEDIILPERSRALSPVLDQALRGKEMVNVEFPLFTKDNLQVDLLLNATTRRDIFGNIVGVICMGQDITERKKAEQEEIRLARDSMTLIETANAPIFGIDRDGNVTEWNQKAAEITRFTRVEVMGRNLVDDFITSEYKRAVKNVLDMALRGEDTANFEFPLFTKDTMTRVEVLLNATCRRDIQGQIVGVIGVGQDITDRKKTELELEKVVKDLRILIDTAHTPIFGLDCEGRVNEWNTMVQLITKRSKEEVMGVSFIDECVLSEHRETLRNVLNKVLEGSECADFEFSLLSKDGKSVEVLLNASTRRDATGDIVGLMGLGLDITERKKADNLHQNANMELKQLMNTANAPIIGIDMEYRISVWNRKVAELTEYPSEDAIGKLLTDLLVAVGGNHPEKAVLEQALQGIPTATFELSLRSKVSSKVVNLVMNAEPRRSPAGNVLGVISVGCQIHAAPVPEAPSEPGSSDPTQSPPKATAKVPVRPSQLPEPNLKLPKARSAKSPSSVTSMDASVEISISGYSEAPSTTISEAPSTTSSEAPSSVFGLKWPYRTMIVVEEARAAATGLDFLKNFPCVTAVEKGADALHLLEGGKCLHIVFIDLKNHPKLGMEIMQACKEGSLLCPLLVGVGDADDIPRQPENDKDDCQAVHLHHYVTRKINEMILEKLLGVLSLQRAAHPRKKNKSMQGENAPEWERLILVVEDNTVSARLLTLMLQKAGYLVKSAMDGKVAVDMISKERFVCILMDCDMPIMDGWEATRCVRNMEREERRSWTPIIAVTANAMAGDKNKCLSAGMDAHITKPVDRNKLLQTLHKWITKRLQCSRAANEQQDIISFDHTKVPDCTMRKRRNTKGVP
ncbi:hypothetical protein CYMTET_12688 [Cymbomonas tetramitiformis]|uniref:histidine kinase n=1 Tax=Cymbomonas tetramitiformis TaxID=36881 RepID=A0AAE0GJY6_9CHLO|nr:hypothetical protein CYMTET_12688 [Cymbomonas tetramitiformis]